MAGLITGCFSSLASTVVTNLACAACCSLASCFGCHSAKAAKAVYAVIFFFATILGLLLKYYGQDWLHWVSTITSKCDNGACWGVQGAYRVSAATTGFFTVMMIAVLLYKRAHLVAWLFKFIMFLGMVAITIAMPSSFFTVYAQIARAASILFLIAQVLIIIDFAYKVHEKLLAKIEARDTDMTTAGWEPGLLSNGWKVLYVIASLVLFAGSIVALAFCYVYFGGCGLTKFYISLTLILGLLFCAASALSKVGRGLLPPCVLFAYCTYMCYGVLTSNPDESGTCNKLVRDNTEDTISILLGCAIAGISVTWAAYRSAGALAEAVLGPPGKTQFCGCLPCCRTPSGGDTGSASAATPLVYGSTSPAPAVTNPSLKARDEAMNDVLTGKSTATEALKRVEEAETASAPVDIARGVADVETGEAKEWAHAQRSKANALAPTAPAAPEDSGDDSDDESSRRGRKRREDLPEDRAAFFHLVMAFGGLYLAMTLTNWANPSLTTTDPSITKQPPGVSEASMWVRVATLWAVELLFAWTLIAPCCCRNRDFS